MPRKKRGPRQSDKIERHLERKAYVEFQARIRRCACPPHEEHLATCPDAGVDDRVLAAIAGVEGGSDAEAPPIEAAGASSAAAAPVRERSRTPRREGPEEVEGSLPSWVYEEVRRASGQSSSSQ